MTEDITAVRARKMQRLAGKIRTELPHTLIGDKLDFLTPELRELARIADTDAVSSNNYDPHGLALINAYPDGLLLDCGSGRRQVYYENVVNFEIVDYDSTDVLGVGEELPFVTGTFDAVFSVAVLEHVRDPFRCAKEIIRVLKPGGKLYCCVPFLQPLHGYPHHYYNMSHQGLRALFEDWLVIDKQEVLPSTWPIWTLTWFPSRWAHQLPSPAKERFLEMKVAGLVGSPLEYLGEDWVAGLPEAAQFELASATVLHAAKPDR